MIAFRRSYIILFHILIIWLILPASLSANIIQRTQPLLVVLVDFNDVKHSYNTKQFDNLFFSPTLKSVYSYYKEVSNGNFIINRANDDYPVSGDNTGLVGWITLNQNHPNCAAAGAAEDTCNRNLVTVSLQAIGPYIDFSKYDMNNDGKITPDELSIIFVVAGYESSYSKDRPAVGANQSNLVDPVILNNKQIFDYAMFGEKHKDHQATMGVMAHELGHLMLDLPDLYDLTYASQGAGPFDLMASGSWGQANSDLFMGETPVHLSTWSKNYSHFISPVPITSDQSGVQLPAVANNTTSVMQLNVSNTGEYFLLENRQFINYDKGFQFNFNTSDNKGGIAIWHIDDSLLSTCIIPNNCNNSPTHKLVDLEEADGLKELDSSSITNPAKLQDLYFADNNTVFNDNSNPNSKFYNGQSSNYAVVNISSPANIMSLDVITNTANSSRIGFNPASLSFKYDYSGTTVPSQTINVSNAGGGTLNWTATSNVGWLALTPTSGSGSGTINVSVNVTGLTVGTYSGSITIKAPLASNSPIKIPVTFVIDYSLPTDSWQVVNPYNPGGNDLQAIAYGNGTFVAAGINGAILTSSNGTNWTTRSSGTTGYFRGVAFGNNVFVAGTAHNGIFVSTNNGQTWTAKGGYDGIYGIGSIAFGNNTFVAVGAVYNASGIGAIVTSSDNGSTWTARNASTAAPLDHVAYGNNTFIATDDNSKMFISHDYGITWVPTTLSSFYPWTITYGNNLFVAYDSYYEKISSSSNNGATWTGRGNIYNYYSGGITYGGNIFLTAGCQDSPTYQGIIYSSTDNGANWIARYNDPNIMCYYDITYGNGTFVAVGAGGKIVQSKPGKPAISFYPISVDFGSVSAASYSTPQTVTIINSGYSQLTVTNLQFTGNNPLDFVTLNDICTNKPLAPSSSCTFQVQYHPSSGGMKNANLNILSNDSINPTATIPLSGIGLFALNVNVVASGSGTVLSAPSGINCSNNCSSHYALNSLVGLYATPAQSYIFAGWSGACSGVDKCTMTMDSDKNLTATFISATDAVARINNSIPSYFPTLAAAYSSAITGNVIQAMVHDFFEDMNLSQTTELTLKGGYDPDYSVNNGYTTLHGSLTIINGALTVENLIVQ